MQVNTSNSSNYLLDNSRSTTTVNKTALGFMIAGIGLAVIAGALITLYAKGIIPSSIGAIAGASVSGTLGVACIVGGAIKLKTKIQKSKDLSHNNFSELSQKTNNLVSEVQLSAIFEYLENDANAAFLERKLKSRGNNPYAVLTKAETGLPFNIEYYGPKNARVRFNKNFAKGTSKISSKLLDIYNSRSLVKSKILISSLEEANRYHYERSKANYTVLSRKLDEIQAEVGRVNVLKDANGQLPEGVLPILEFQQYSKACNARTIHKAAIVTEEQTDSLNNFNFVEAHSPADKIKMTWSLVKIVADLHTEKRVAHHDIKGENILWTRRGQEIDLKLIDFDFSRPLDSTEAQHMGTPRYACPEAFRKPYPEGNIKTLNEAKDSFSLGVTILIDIWGIYPDWVGDKNDATVAKKVLTPFNNLDLSPLPSEIAALLKGLIDPNPKSRLSPTMAWDQYSISHPHPS